MSGFSIGDLFTSISAGLGITIILTVVSFVAGAIIAVPLALTRVSKFLPARWLAIGIIDICRGVPPLVWLLIIYYGISPILALEPLPAALIGLSLISGAYLAENYRSGIDNVSRGQREAAAALGLTPTNQFWRVVAPQALNLALPPSASYAVSLLKDSAKASIIGVADIIFVAQLEVSRGASAVFVFSVAAVLYLIVGIPLSYFSRFVDAKIRDKVVSV
ncbi:amino acid ABC transporter permease [Gulosibacter sp. ACHW.36C]|jgi:His/Glu/Gln/Arg/opine family amino acid ABC transporter permease subunit|uniref:Amino acid ABC transporter permease n=1 Tax=Gulosibacter sediminis TaxID=1729695 RepID=A0ABY4MZB4_9MICO|nr:amino acid ABC transporter permease [Gulosibacter sediminis]UQN15119.1 amino acid ABC transporter permease [Gulosibacter sediminis]